MMHPALLLCYNATLAAAPAGHPAVCTDIMDGAAEAGRDGRVAPMSKTGYAVPLKVSMATPVPLGPELGAGRGTEAEFAGRVRTWSKMFT